MKKERQNNFELLKVICIVFIIIHHFYTHGAYDHMIIEGNISRMILVSFLGSFGKCASLIFILITGYFMAHKEFNYKKVFMIIFQFLFYNIVILLLLTVWTHNVDIKSMIRLLFPIFFGNWFVVSYIQLLLLSPIINKVFQSCDKKTITSFLFLCIFGFFFIPTFVPGTSWNLSNLGIFVITYIVGMYFHYYDVRFKSIYFVVSIISLMIVFLFDVAGIVFGNSFVGMGIDFDAFHSIFMFILAISVFLYFKGINIKTNMFQILASSSLGIYILHDNSFIRNIIWNDIVPNHTIVTSNLFYIFYPLKVFFVFVIFFLFDKILMKIFHKAIHCISNKLFHLIEVYIKRRGTYEEKN